ncbi:TPA: IS3 family transposase [Legionella pneumophila]|nr:IS3 family transposase [Legionella pneumophila]HAT1994240.1 IS3 family transposase [Legionella pneumophila]HAT2051887.1 IS3 family transposase [Legionella pneumophila]HAT2061289.1 IS3 family transposase [Legionella pneumophila]HAT4435657.1 IS3 family transposase [Legionella pneumophila]
MIKQKKKGNERKYSPQFKDQAVEHAEKDGVRQVAQDLGIPETMLYGWRTKKRQGGDTLENQKLQQAEMSRLRRECARLAEEKCISKKGGCVLRQGVKVRYAMIKEASNRFNIQLMCRLLCVSASGYYAWLNRKPPKRAERNSELTRKIKVLFDEEKSRAGAPRITKRLNQQGENVGKQRVTKIMREHGWRAKASKKFKATTNSNHQLPVAPNLLQQNFTACKPNEKWVSDITYCWTEEGWLYLAVVMDLYSRKIVGWALSERMTKQLVIDALQMAIWGRKPPKGLIIHSDRGSQYCSYAYQQLLSQHGLVCSMSKRGDCYDNAAMESWNHSFKIEAIHGEKFTSRSIAKNHIFEYIEIYYNRKRLHSRLEYLSPFEFEVKKVA